MYFYNKLIWSHKHEYYLLETWLNMKNFNWHVIHSSILLGTEVLPILSKHDLLRIFQLIGNVTTRPLKGVVSVS